jgi:hypothetical protein
VLHAGAVDDEDVGDTVLDDVELLGGVSLGDDGRAGRKAAAGELVQGLRDLLRRNAVEDRAAGRWTRGRCSMRFDRCQNADATPSLRKIGIRRSGSRSRRS